MLSYNLQTQREMSPSGCRKKAQQSAKRLRKAFLFLPLLGNLQFTGCGNTHAHCAVKER